MRSISLKSSGIKKIEKDENTLHLSDIEDGWMGFTPGEWILFKDEIKKNIWIGFINNKVKDHAPIHLMAKLSEKPTNNSIEELIRKRIITSVEKRNFFEGYDKNARIIYGMNDDLPGLVVDLFNNVLMVQVNLAGMEVQKNIIESILTQKFKLPIIFRENSRHREREGLPPGEKNPRPEIETLEVVENKFKYN